MGIFNVGISGLNVAQVGLLTTSHNISNASTPGYNRQLAIQTTNTPMFTGVGYLGQGSHVETIRRIYSQQLQGQMMSAQAGASEMDSYLSQISQIDNLLADPSAGLSPALSAFFGAVQEMAANPASVPARQAMLSASQSLVARFQAIDQRLTEVRNGVNAQITSVATAINSYAVQIAEINQRIIYASAIGPNQPPNDLLDQRDQLIAELNKEIRVTTLEQGDGTLSVFIGNGQPLVIGTDHYTVSAVAAPDDLERITIALKLPTGQTAYMPESLITGGTLGGLIAFRSGSLDEAQNALGRIALTLAQNFNDQHRLGQDLTGALGGDYFDMSNVGAVEFKNGNNTGNAVIVASVAAVGNLTTSDYRLSYDGTNYTLTRLSDNKSQAYTLGTEVDGISISLSSGTPQAGDSFLIQPTRNGAKNLAMAIADPREIAAAAPIRTEASLDNTGTGSISAGVALDTTNPNLWATTTLNFVAGGYQVNGAGPVIPYTSGANIDLNGWRVVVTGTPAVGDVFTIERNSNGVADNRNGVLLAALQTANKLDGGKATYQSSYSALVAKIGNKAREVEITGQAQQSLLEQAQTRRDEMSAVNLDEEAANLLRYQQAYQAAARMIDIAANLFDEVLALGR
jgi:flagellar hook-associated protein 1 FlgK